MSETHNAKWRATAEQEAKDDLSSLSTDELWAKQSRTNSLLRAAISAVGGLTLGFTIGPMVADFVDAGGLSVMPNLFTSLASELAKL